MKITNSEPKSTRYHNHCHIIIIVTIFFALKCSLKHCISRHCATMTTTNECCGNFEYAGTYMKRHHCDKYTKPVLDLDIVKGYVLCTAEHCSRRSRNCLNFTEILKADTLRLQQLWKNYYIFE